MPRKKLILFTSDFPYGKGESFIETELPFLADKFDIVIVPITMADDHQRNALGALVLRPVLKKNKFLRVFIGIFNSSPLLFCFKEFLSQEIYLQWFKFPKWFSDSLYIRTLLSREELKNQLSDADILYSYWGDFTSYICLFRSYKAKIIVRYHAADLYEDKIRYMPYREKLLKRIDLAIFISSFGEQYLKSKYSDINFKSIVSRLGVKNFGINPESVEENFVLLSCSFLRPKKRVHLIAESLKFVKENISWIHIGSGTFDQRLKKSLNNLPKNIKSKFTGFMSPNKIIEFYLQNHVDLFINVSDSEGIPVAIMEAMSYGIPVLATNVGGVSEIVNETNGYLVDKDISSTDLSNLISKIINSNLSKLRIEAWNEWDRRYNSVKNYSSFVQSLENLTNE